MKEEEILEEFKQLPLKEQASFGCEFLELMIGIHEHEILHHATGGWGYWSGGVDSVMGKLLRSLEGKRAKLKVWHIPQVPGNPFLVDVDSKAEGKKIMDILAEYDLFQFDNNIKPDYSSVSGLQEEQEEGGWHDVDLESEE